MKKLNFVRNIFVASAFVVSTSALSAPLAAATPSLSLGLVQPLRTPTLQLINPVIANKFTIATKDYKTFHGSMCQPFYGSQQTYVDHRDNGLYNKSAAARTVVCPIVRDNVNKTSGVWAAIYVNNVAGKSFSCWVDSRDPWGKVIQWVNRRTNLGGNRTLRIDVYNMVQNGNFNLYCSVPAKARIASYKTGEILRTDSNN